MCTALRRAAECRYYCHKLSTEGSNFSLNVLLINNLVLISILQYSFAAIRKKLRSEGRRADQPFALFCCN